MSRKSTGSSDIDMTFILDNFGPIRKAEIKLKPLTILTGANGSGKSYAAKAIHSLINTISQYDKASFNYEMRYRIRDELRISMDDRILGSFLDQLHEFITAPNGTSPKGVIVVPSKLVTILTHLVFSQTAERLEEHLMRSFASSVYKLKRAGSKSSKLKIRNTVDADFSIKKSGIASSFGSLKGLHVGIRRESEKKISVFIMEEDRLISVNSADGSRFARMKRSTWYLFDFVVSSILKVITGSLLRNRCHYLPAARSGILQGHRALVAGLVDRAPLFGIEEIQIPRFSGAIADLVKALIYLPEEEGQFSSLASEMETQITGGKIKIIRDERTKYPEILLHMVEGEYSIHCAASSVSEVAPLILYTRYILEPGNILMIEEPEAHLHPGNQVKLANLIIDLVNGGVTVVVTTHSDFFIQGINQSIRRGYVEDKKQYEQEGTRFIDPNKVSAYLMQYSEKGGTIAKPIPMTNEEGISEEMFAVIRDELYEDALLIDDDLFN